MTKTERAVSGAAGWLHTWGTVTGILILLAGAVGALAWYGYHELAALKGQVAELAGELASTTVALEGDIAKTNSALESSLASQQSTVAGVSSQVATLEKLQSLDPQLLAKYSKTYFLNENYIPAALAAIPSKYHYYTNKTEQTLPQVLPHLEGLLDAASTTGNPLYVESAYRSFDTQAALKSEYVVTFGAGTAGQFSADQGLSEHQLGTAVDLITTGLGGQLTDAFAKTDAYAWLTDHAYQYGFILSYPPGNSYYIFEPWHWRYVGVQLATYLHNSGKHFYDLDQRTIDTYLAGIFD